MTEYERKAEKIIMLAYNKGGYININEVLSKLDESYLNDNITKILEYYGSVASATFSSKYGWNDYQLSEKGMIFARTGCFTGERIKVIWTKIGAIAAIVAAITGLINCFL